MIIEQETYNGNLIHQRFAYSYFRDRTLPIGNIVAFRAPMLVETDGMIDEEDIIKGEFIYSDESYKKLRLNDISIKKNNTTNKRIAEENDLYVSEISGYPAFYTQMIFDTFDKTIKLKSVLNNSEGISIISNCEKIIKYKIES